MNVVAEDPAAMVPTKDMDAVKRTLGILGPRLGPLVDLFYMRLFAIAPAARGLFPDDMSAQNDKFDSMLGDLVRLIDRPEDFADRVRDLGRRHRDYGAEPRHYALVEEALVWALARELGPAFTPHVEESWKSFYRSLSRTMIEAAGL